MEGPTISRGEMYGGEEGKQSDSMEASGMNKSGASPALFWIAALAILIVIRMAWEAAD